MPKWYIPWPQGTQHRDYLKAKAYLFGHVDPLGFRFIEGLPGNPKTDRFRGSAHCQGVITYYFVGFGVTSRV